MRPLLVVALAFSLWPVGAILLLGEEEDRSTVEWQVPALAGSGKTSAARTELETIASDVHALNEELVDTELVAGEPEMVAVFDAWSILEDLRAWSRARRRVATRHEKRIAKKMAALLIETHDLAETPSQKNLRIYNRALSEFNAAVR